MSGVSWFENQGSAVSGTAPASSSATRQGARPGKATGSARIATQATTTSCASGTGQSVRPQCSGSIARL